MSEINQVNVKLADLVSKQTQFEGSSTIHNLEILEKTVAHTTSKIGEACNFEASIESINIDLKELRNCCLKRVGEIEEITAVNLKKLDSARQEFEQDIETYKTQVEQQKGELMQRYKQSIRNIIN